MEDEVVPGLGDLTPLLITSALVVGLRLDIFSPSNLTLTSDMLHDVQRGVRQRDLPGHHRPERHGPRWAVGGAQPQRHPQPQLRGSVQPDLCWPEEEECGGQPSGG